jgi:uncharacterized coiled-coil protein SlyX
VERSEAEAIYDQGRDAVVAVLLRMDEQIQRLEKRVAAQDKRIAQLESCRAVLAQLVAAAEQRSAKHAAQAWQGSVGAQTGRAARP